MGTVSLELVLPVIACVIAVAGFIRGKQKDTGQDEKWKGSIEAKVEALQIKNKEQDERSDRHESFIVNELKELRSELKQDFQTIMSRLNDKDGK